jgi:hypothetical protein
VNYLDIFQPSHDLYFQQLSYVSCQLSRYFSAFSHFIFSTIVICLLSITSIFVGRHPIYNFNNCHTSPCQLSRHFVAGPTVNYLDILSDVSRWITSFFSGVSEWNFYTYFVGCLRVNNLDILPGVSRYIISIFCRASHGKYSRYYFGRLVVTYPDILSGVSRWIIDIFSGATGEHYEYFVGCLTVNYLDIS